MTFRWKYQVKLKKRQNKLVVDGRLWATDDQS